MSLFDQDLASRDPRDIIVTVADFGSYVETATVTQTRVDSDIYDLNERYARLEMKVDEYKRRIDFLENEIVALWKVIEDLKSKK